MCVWQDSKHALETHSAHECTAFYGHFNPSHIVSKNGQTLRMKWLKDFIEVWGTLREKCLYSEFFWPVFSHIRTEYRNIYIYIYIPLKQTLTWWLQNYIN